MFNSKIKRLSWGERGKVLVDTIKGFFAVKGTSQAAAMAYYALFAMIPLLYLSLSVYGRIIGESRMQEIVSNLLIHVVKVEDVKSILNFVSSLKLERGSVLMDVVGGVVLVFSSSALMVSLKDSINLYMGVSTSHFTRKQAILEYVIFRAASMLMITVLSILLILIYFFQLVVGSLGDKLIGGGSTVHWIFSGFLSSSILIAGNILFFTIVFKYFHSGKTLWRVAFLGAAFTTLLLMLSQWLIKYYLSNFFFAANGGIAGSLMVIMLWVFYSSLIIFLGAKFTAVYAKAIGMPIQA